MALYTKQLRLDEQQICPDMSYMQLFTNQYLLIYHKIKERQKKIQ